MHEGSKIRREAGRGGAYVERANVKVEETMQVVDAHGLVVVHLRRPRDCRAGGVQPAAPEWGEARGWEKAVAVPLALRLRGGGGGEAEAHESFRHGEWSEGIRGKREMCSLPRRSGYEQDTLLLP